MAEKKVTNKYPNGEVVDPNQTLRGFLCLCFTNISFAVFRT